MKKILLFTVTATVLFFISCNSCGGNNAPVGVIIENDSIFMVNDSTVGDVQTFIFEGTSPMNGNAVADVVLAISTISLNDDGTYTITTDYIDEGLATQNDNGEAMIISGNDSTMTVIQLLSANNYPTISFAMQQDSSLVKVDADGKSASHDSAHKLNLKK